MTPPLELDGQVSVPFQRLSVHLGRIVAHRACGSGLSRSPYRSHGRGYGLLPHARRSQEKHVRDYAPLAKPSAPRICLRTGLITRKL